jgi:hypothetical protein
MTPNEESPAPLHRTAAIADEKSFYRAGAIAFLIPGIIWTVLNIPVVIIVTVRGESPLDSAQSVLNQIISRPMMPRINEVLAILNDISMIVGFVMLAFVLRHISRVWPIIAVVLVAVGCLYDMSDGLIQWAMTHHYADYPAASGATLAAYNVNNDLIWRYIYKVVTPFFAIVIGLGITMVSWTMLGSDVPRWIAYLGFTVAVFAFVGGLTTFFVLMMVVAFWYVAVGIHLLRRARGPAPARA